MLHTFIEQNDAAGLRAVLLENYRDVDTSKIEVLQDDYFTEVDEDMANRCEDIKKAVSFAIEKGSSECLDVLCRLYSFLDFSLIAIATLVKGDIELYKVLLNFQTELVVAKAHLCITPFSKEDILKSINKLLSVSTNSRMICNMLYSNITLGCVDYIEDLHKVLLKHADPEKHYLLEERILELLNWGTPQQVRPIYEFITSHPECAWKDKNGNTLMHYLSLSKLHCGYMKSILGIN